MVHVQACSSPAFPAPIVIPAKYACPVSHWMAPCCQNRPPCDNDYRKSLCKELGVPCSCSGLPTSYKRTDARNARDSHGACGTRRQVPSRLSPDTHKCGPAPRRRSGAPSPQSTDRVRTRPTANTHGAIASLRDHPPDECAHHDLGQTGAAERLHHRRPARFWLSGLRRSLIGAMAFQTWTPLT